MEASSLRVALGEGRDDHPAHVRERAIVPGDGRTERLYAKMLTVKFRRAVYGAYGGLSHAGVSYFFFSSCLA